MKKIIFLSLSLILLASCASIPKNLTSTEKEFLSQARYIIAKEEEQAFIKLPSASEKEQFIEEFWLKRDPTPNTTRNEFKEIYFQRIETANRLYRSGRPGWLTERGMIYILFGPPSDVEEYPMGITSEDKPAEIWIYNNLPGKPQLRLEFVDYSNTNDYRLVTSFSRETMSAFIPGRMFIPFVTRTESGRITGAQVLPQEAPSTRKSPQEIQMEKIQETGKAITTSQAKPEVKEGEVKVSYQEIKIPSEVGEIFDQNVSTKTPRTDIAITSLRTLYLPTQQNNVHAVFLFKIKNADLNFQEEARTPEQIEEDLVSQKLSADLHVFLRFYKMEKGKAKEMLKEIYIPYLIEADKQGFDLEEENLYSIGDPLPPGDYLLALAFASTDLSEIGTTYIEFSLPDLLRFPKKLETSPVFFVESLQRISSPETEVKVHKNCFFYSVLKIEPKMENIFQQGETPDIFYFIYGARPNQERKFDLEIDYKVKKGKEEVINYATQTYSSPFISHSLPFKMGEKYLEPGQYTLEMKIRDKISNLSLKKDVPFEVE
jgi:GWxTD domain-containing protein